MKLKSWHISTLAIVAIFVGIFIAGGSGATIVGALLLLSLFPALTWFGWTLHARKLDREFELENRIRERIRTSDGVPRRRANDNV